MRMPSHGPIKIMAQLSIGERFQIVFPRVPCCQVGLEAPRPQLRYHGEELHVQIAAEKSHAIFGYVFDDLVPEVLQGLRPCLDLFLCRHVIQVHTHERYRVLVAEHKKRIRQETIIHVVIAILITGGLLLGNLVFLGFFLYVPSWRTR